MANVMSMLEKLKWVEKMEKNDDTIESETSQELEDIEEAVDFGEYKPPVKVEKQLKMEDKEEIEYEARPEKNMSINEIYSANNVDNNIMNTVFLLESYINALPQDLPYEVKKTSVINIVTATKSDLNHLLNEGEKRIKILNAFMNDFQQSLNAGIGEYKAEIFKLSKMIDEYKILIDEKETMLEEQKNIVKFEANKINNIIDFFNNENKR